jgi:predicted nucleic acid binding AN1-type Zn finger protein
MEPIIAVCGLDCSVCAAYKATQAKDETAKERIAAQWRADYNNPKIDAAYVTCDGCLASDGRLGGHCLECEPRLCAVGRGYPNCAYCPDYGCEKINQLLVYIPEAKTRLDGIRAAL